MTRARSLPWLLLLAAPLLAQDRTPPVDPAASRKIELVPVPPVPEGTPSLRMLVVGDWGTGTKDQKLVAAAMAEQARAQKLDLILTTGDNFYPSGVRSVDDKLWEVAFERIYTDPALKDVPWWPSLGNHDHKGNLDAQVEYSKKSPRWKLPARHYTTSFPLGSDAAVQLFVLDTQPLMYERELEQYEWLKKELAASKATWKLVVGHHPIRSRSIRPDSKQLVDRLEPILFEQKVDMYLAGHDHCLELFKPIQGLTYLVSGGGAGPGWAYKVEWTEDLDYAATGGGFAVLRFTPSDCWIEFVRNDGKAQFAKQLAKGPLGPY